MIHYDDSDETDDTILLSETRYPEILRYFEFYFRRNVSAIKNKNKNLFM